jgi:hypothetical protein
MKRPISYAAILLFMLLSATGFCQNTTGAKPKLFANYPDHINCSVNEFSKSFVTAQDQNINLTFSDNFLFNGTVTSNVVKYANLQTAVIRSASFSNAIFVLSKITNADGSINYVGHIINTKYFDGYDLKKDASGNYQLVKIETGAVLQDCKQE